MGKTCTVLLRGIIIIVFFTSCFIPPDKPVNFSSDYYNGNEDQFTFLIFDKSNCDSFLIEYAPLNNGNMVMRDSIRSILLGIAFEQEADSSIFKTLTNYTSNTESPDNNSYILAQTVIDSSIANWKSDYFGASLSYLFYYKCLPHELRYKWHQTTLGNFTFNVTFFNRLRQNNHDFDAICYGEKQNQDSRLAPIFREYISNEISVDDAASMKSTIETNSVFNDDRFKNDKMLFLTILNQVAEGKWRM